MQIIKDTVDFKIEEPTVVTIGKFDGIHLGHKLIFDTMKDYRAKGLKTCVLTFDKSPAHLGFSGDKKVLMTMKEKEMALEVLGIDYLVEFPFYEKTAAILAIDFIEHYIVEKMHAKAVVVGTDCSFGQGAKGNADMLKDYGPIYDYEARIIGKLKDGDKEISSTYIRELMREGNVKKVSELSYRPCYLRGKLKSTADADLPTLKTFNMDIGAEKIAPKAGLYYSYVLFDDFVYPGLTFVPSEGLTSKTYLYSDMKGITSSVVALLLLDRMRDEIKFKDNEERSRQMKSDIFEAQKWHKENCHLYEDKFSRVEA